MKKIFFASLLTLSAAAAFSQAAYVRKGDWMLGGNAGFTSEKQGDYKTTSVRLSPNAGYFFIDQLAGGLRASVSSAKSEYGTSESTGSGFSLAPFLRYYILPSSQKLNVFADASFGVGRNKYETGTIENKNNFTVFGIRAGAAVFLLPSAALELGIGYSSLKTKDVSDRENAFGVEVGFQIHLPGKAKK